MFILQKTSLANIDEKIIYYVITLTYPLYLLGALYLAGPILGWVLLFRCFAHTYTIRTKLNSIAMLWILSILLIEIVLVIGSLNTGHDFLMVIKSSIGWAKGWFLIGIFILAGTILPVSYVVLQKAIINILLQSLVIAIIVVILSFLNSPTLLYTSPLKILGGGGDQFFKVWIYWFDVNTNMPRWQLFAPWSPALGFYALLALSIILPRPSDKFKYLAMISCVLLVFMSQSRTGVIILLLILGIFFIYYFFDMISILIIVLITIMTLSIFIENIIIYIDIMMEKINRLRSDSSMIRNTLSNIGIYRWQNEAFWFGHGNVEAGPHIVQFMPIGSHNTFIGLLFTKGLVGILLYMVPLIVSICFFTYKSFYKRDFLAGFFVIVIFTIYSFTENVEILSYIMWPGWFFIGLVLRASQQDCYLDDFYYDEKGRCYIRDKND